jgi:hypothetical protein
MRPTALEKGYDSGKIHRIIRENPNSYSILLVRTRKLKQISGGYR